MKTDFATWEKGEKMIALFKKKQGNWIRVHNYFEYPKDETKSMVKTRAYRCSKCHRVNKWMTPYCPWCGEKKDNTKCVEV